MNRYETSIIKAKLIRNQEFIKAQHRLPKSERNQKDILIAKRKTVVLKRWLGL